MPLLILLFVLNFLPQDRPYSVGYNFQITIDSITAQDDDPLLTVDSVRTHSLTRGQTLVVAQFQTVPTDSIDSVWVQVGTFVAADSMGIAPQAELVWLRESELMKSAVPDLAVSKAIHGISLRAYTWRVITLGFLLFLLLSRFLRYFDTSTTQGHSPQRQNPVMLLDPLPTIYPTLLAGIAAIATALSMHIPQHEWMDFYFNPTINPFSAASGAISAVLALVWLALVLFITTITEVFLFLPFPRAVIYTLSIPGVCTAVVWLLMRDMPLWLTWTIAVAFVIATLADYLRRGRTPYTCGKCGAPLRNLGICPHCGTENKI